MNTSVRSSHMKSTWSRGKSRGWAAFDLKQREKDGFESKLDSDPYPPMPSSHYLNPCKKFSMNGNLSPRPFSSLFISSLDFFTSTGGGFCAKQTGESSKELCNQVVEEHAFKKLKDLYTWADTSLINDILAAVNNDIDQASNVLKDMDPSGRLEVGDKVTHAAELGTAPKDSVSDNNTLLTDNGFCLGKFNNMGELGLNPDGCLSDKKKGQFDECTPFNCLRDDVIDMEHILGRVRCIPIEPEWEEDDVYLMKRKDALRIMRSASHHSKSATNAFLRGDHLSARQLSRKAQEEWRVAEELNAKAAKEILSIRNFKKSLWELDLHGLHASEAVKVLQERLHKIETEVQQDHLSSPSGANMRNETVQSSEPLSCFHAHTSVKQSLSSQRSRGLQVITGIGNHSQSQAALPAAVRSFLDGNCYRYDEARPGVITVKPKFRCSWPRPTDYIHEPLALIKRETPQYPRKSRQWSSLNSNPCASHTISSAGDDENAEQS